MYNDVTVAIYKSAHKEDFDNVQIDFRALDLTLQTVKECCCKFFAIEIIAATGILYYVSLTMQ